MSNYPNELDDDTTLPRVDNNITQIGGDAINALRSAVFNIEDTLGINPAGTAGNLAAFLAVAHNPDGSIQPSVLTSLGLVVLPITDPQVSPTAGIQESKLALDYPTSALFSFIQQVNLGTQQSLNFITNHGSKIEPHIQGVNFNHYMNAILVAPTSLNYFTNDQGLFRDNSNLYNLFNDLNTDYIKHQVANNTPVTFANGQQTGGTVPPTNYAHVSAGIYLNTSNFSFIPETTTNLQAFAEFVDGSNVLLLGTRIQTLYQNGIPRTASSSSLLSQTQGQVVIPPTPVTTFLLDGYYTTPVDDINHGDDVIVFNPVNDDGYTFDSLFAAVRIGDIITVTYVTATGLLPVSNIVTETKYLVSPDQSSQTFAVRIDGKNLQNATNATATITRSLFNNEKFGVLALAQANHNINGILPTLIVGNPQGAEAFSVNFNAGLIDSNHYNLYLAVYPNGNPMNGIFNMPAIDISGNQGSTPGAYTIDSVILNINNKFRSPGYNNRFMAFQYQGNLGIKMTDSINNISFSILDGVVNPTTGLYNQALSNTVFPANVIGVPGFDPIDPSGLGPSGAGLSGPQFATSFSSSLAAQVPAKIIAPLTRRTFYVNGSEEERFALQPFQTLDGYGDGYWPATIISKTIVPGVRVETTYQVNLNLSTSGLQIGKTLTVTSASFIDSGRYFISNIQFNDCTGCNTNTPASIVSTNITVYDAIQSPSGTSPSASAGIGTIVSIYFSADSVGFDAENISDANNVAPFKRHMEIYVDDAGNTFSHERARMYIGNAIVPSSAFSYSFTGLSIGNPLSPTPLYGDVTQSLISMNIVDVSDKLRGFPYSGVDKINLQMISYNSSTGDFDGYLCNFNALGNVVTNRGPTVSGKKGEVTRFYDQTNVEYIDVAFNISDTISNFSNAYIDIQLFPTLSLDQNVMLLGTVQVNNQNNIISYLVDQRQFGNTSEVQFSTSALDFIAAAPGYTTQNGVVRGLDLISVSPVTNLNNTTDILITGGLALTNGVFNAFNPITVNIPLVQDNNAGAPIAGVLWAVCVNENGDPQLIPLTDFNPAVNSINNPGRLLQLFNVVNSLTYYVDSTTFSQLINTRKDLTVLYLVNSQVTNATTWTMSIVDARKYVTDATANSYAVVTSDVSQGNFKSISAVNVWNQYNSSFQSTIILRGEFVFNTDPGFTSNATYQGDGYSTLTFNSSVTFPSGCVFEHCNFTFNNGAVVNNTTFVDCIININTSPISGNTLTISESTVNVATTRGFTLGNNYKFEGTTFNYAPPSPIGDGFYSSSDLVNYVNAMMYSSLGAGGSLTGLTVKDCVFTTALTDHYGFISLQLNDISAYVKNVIIDSNVFNSTAVTNDLRSIITFVSTTSIAPSLAPTNAVVKNPTLYNVSISNNVCNYDQMIAITTVRSNGGTGFNEILGPLLSTMNCKVTGNSCGVISFIVASTVPYSGSNSDISVPGDRPDQLNISNNNCKFITNLDALGQYIEYRLTVPDGGTGSVSHHDLVPVGTGPALINGNTVNWIQVGASAYGTYVNLTTIAAASNGQSLPQGTINVLSTAGFASSGTILVTTSSGQQSVTYTGISGIAFTGCSGGTGTMSTGGSVTSFNNTFDGITITNNKLSPGNPSFLLNYSDTNNGPTISPGNYAITLRREFNGTGSTKSIISNNTITQKSNINTTNGTVNLYYYEYGIACLNSATITGNTIVGCINNSVNPNAAMLTLIGSGNIIASNNFFDRAGQTIGSYIYNAPPSSTGATNIVVVTHNIFDSQFVDATNTLEAPTNNLALSWSVYQNKNQIGYTNANSEAFDWLQSDANTYKIYNGANSPGGNPYYSAFFSSAGTNFVAFTTLQLDPYLPPGSQLLYLAIGTSVGTGDGSPTTLHGTLRIDAGQLVSNVFPANPATLGAYLATQPNTASSFNATGVATLGGTTANNFSYIDLTSTAPYANRANSLYVTITINALSTNNNDYLLLSPLMIKYKY